MIKVLQTLTILILLSACGNRDYENEIRLSTLIEPDYTYTQDLFNCSLNQNQSLISLETFFSKNISKYETFAEKENISLSIFFPNNNSNITNFIISIISNKNASGIKKFIDSIKNNVSHEPNFKRGAEIQNVLDKCALSSNLNSWVDI